MKHKRNSREVTKKSPNQRIVRHEFGTPNPIMVSEEEVMLAMVDKALRSTSNSQVIGRNGEIPLINFFNRYLPYTFRAVTGHFIPPSGHLSPQIDVMILDARYPLLAENTDGSVLAMLHSVIHTIEVKTRITSRDIEKSWGNSIKIMELASEVDRYGSMDWWGAIQARGFAYRSAQLLDTLEKKYIEVGKPEKAGFDIFILRLPAKDQITFKDIGAEFHFEPDFESNDIDKVIGFEPLTRESYTPLSDLYYNLVQNAYYILATRNYSFQNIGQHLNEYMTWSTFKWWE